MAANDPNGQNMLTLQQGILNELKKMTSLYSNTAKAREVGKVKRAERKKESDTKKLAKEFDTLTKKFDKLGDNTEKLDKQFSKSEKTFKDAEKSATVLGKSFKEFVKDSLIPGKKHVKEWQDTYQKLVDNQSGDYKELAQNTRDYIKNNKGAIASIRNATGQYKSYNDLLKNISKNQGKLSKQDQDAARKYTEVVNKMYKDAGMKNKLSVDEKKALESLHKTTELTATELKKLASAVDKIGDDFKTMGDVAEGYSTGLNKALTEAGAGVRGAIVTMFKGLANSIGAAFPVIVKDLRAQAKNAVGQSDYREAFRGGLSEAELAQFTGENRLALRSIGGGKAGAPIANGQFRGMTDAAMNFGGYTGQEAAKYIGETMQNLVKMGSSVSNVNKQMESNYTIMQQTGMSLDEVNKLFADLGDSPAFLQLIQAKGYQGQADVVGNLQKMLKGQGYGNDYLKQLLELQKQRQYQGIEEAVKGMVGVQLLGNQLGLSKDDIGIQQELAGRGVAGVQQRYAQGGYAGMQVNGQSVESQFGTGQAGADAFIKYALQRQTAINEKEQQSYAGASSGALIPGLVQKELLNRFSSMAGPEFQQRDAALQAQSQRQSYYGTTNQTQAQTDALLGKNDTVKSLKDINSLLPAKFNELILTIDKWIDAFKKSPLGAAAGGIGTVGKGALGYLGARTALGTLSKFLPGAGEAGAGAAGGFGSKLLSTAGGFGKNLIKGAPLIGGLVSGGLDYAENKKAGHAVGTGAGAGLGAWGGAAAGAAIGSVVPVVGTAVGAVLGGLAGGYGGSKLGGGIGGWFDSDKKNPTSLSPQEHDNANQSNSVTDQQATDGSSRTIGEILQSIDDRLKMLTDTEAKLLNLTDDTHKEYMDFVTKNSNDAKVQAARGANLTALHSAGY